MDNFRIPNEETLVLTEFNQIQSNEISLKFKPLLNPLSKEIGCILFKGHYLNTKNKPIRISAKLYYKNKCYEYFDIGKVFKQVEVEQVSNQRELPELDNGLYSLLFNTIDLNNRFKFIEDSLTC